MKIEKWEMIQVNISIGIGKHRHQDMVQIAEAIFCFKISLMDWFFFVGILEFGSISLLIH